MISGNEWRGVDVMCDIHGSPPGNLPTSFDAFSGAGHHARPGVRCAAGRGPVGEDHLDQPGGTSFWQKGMLLVAASVGIRSPMNCRMVIILDSDTGKLLDQTAWG